MRMLRLFGFIAALSASLLAQRGAAQTKVRMLYGFPYAQGQPLGVVAGPAGQLYGITAGVAFELQPPAAGSGGEWTESVLYTFNSENGGGFNYDFTTPSLVAAPDGNIYGTTSGGGAYGFGIVFELQPPQDPGGSWTETALYSFTSGTFSIYDLTGTVIFANGLLFGANPLGGAYGQGLVFELQPPAGNQSGGPWVETDLYSFTGGSDGAEPIGVTIGPGGVLYGMTSGGGSVGGGVVFALKPPTIPGEAWTEKVLYNFLGGEAGGGGSAYGMPVIGSDGSLYGISGPAIFRLAPPAPGTTNWTESRLYGQTSPDSPVVMRDGAIYGTTGEGTVYKLQPPEGDGAWTETILNQFNGYYVPSGSFVVNKNGAVFGTATNRPGLNNGVAYEVKP